MTSEELAAIEARANAATPARPLRFAVRERGYMEVVVEVGAEDGLAAAFMSDKLPSEERSQDFHDSIFAAFARADITALIARIRELEAALGGSK